MAAGKDLLELLFGDWRRGDLYRFHMAKPNGAGSTPLQALARSDEQWSRWQLYRGDKSERFTKDFVATFAQISGNRFLFGGLYKIADRSGEHYDVELTNDLKQYIGRLVVRFDALNRRRTVFTPEYFFENANVAELYSRRYQGEVFPGVDRIHHGFRDMEVVFEHGLPDWKSALSAAKGVYLIVDEETGLQYVGSAAGEDGFWGRWSQYMLTLHGGNKMLAALVRKEGADALKGRFRYSILEVTGSALTMEQVVDRESSWKEKLGSRAFGLNAN